MALGAEFREDHLGVTGSAIETRVALTNAGTHIKELFFPESEIEIAPASPWSPNVLVVQVDGKLEYIAKSFHPGRKDLLVLEKMHEWAANITPSLPIAVPQYIPTRSGEYFPVVGSQDQTRICLMEKLPLEPFALHQMDDFRRMGVALGILHGLAPAKIDSLPTFRFSHTNTEVESYWQYLDKDEETMFRRILGVELDNDNQGIQLTHNDLHPANLLGTQGTPTFIDFDQMLVGPRANDFGQLLSAFWLDNTSESFDESMAHFIDGYRMVNSVEISEVAAIPYFSLRKIFISFAWFKGLMHVRNDRQAADFYLLLKRRAEVLFQHAVDHKLI
ncbi:MAG: phosphotransferase [bacterium]